MKLSDKMLKELNKQYNIEVHSAYIYRNMAIWANAQDLPGMKSWMEHQYNEEMSHAEKIYNYINERNADVTLDKIDKPEGKWDSMLDVMKAALKHEEYVSSRFIELTDLANADKDYATTVFLQWFLTEQVEEEEQSMYWVKRIEKCNDQVGALMIVDGEMGRRG